MKKQKIIFQWEVSKRKRQNLHANNNNNPKIMWNVIFLWKFSCWDGGKFLLRKPEIRVTHKHTHDMSCWVDVICKSVWVIKEIYDGTFILPRLRLWSIYSLWRSANGRLEIKFFFLTQQMESEGFSRDLYESCIPNIYRAKVQRHFAWMEDNDNPDWGWKKNYYANCDIATAAMEEKFIYICVRRLAQSRLWLALVLLCMMLWMFTFLKNQHEFVWIVYEK